MSKNLGKQLAILRLIPILVLVCLAFGLEHVIAIPRLWAVGMGLVAALLVRLLLMRVWTPK